MNGIGKAGSRARCMCVARCWMGERGDILSPHRQYIWAAYLSIHLLIACFRLLSWSDLDVFPLDIIPEASSSQRCSTFPLDQCNGREKGAATQR